MSTEPSDTSEAIRRSAHMKVHGDLVAALACVDCRQWVSECLTAPLRALPDAGWVEVPKVKVKRAIPGKSDQRYCNGYNDALEDLQFLGLPIELDES